MSYQTNKHFLSMIKKHHEIDEKNKGNIQGVQIDENNLLHINYENGDVILHDLDKYSEDYYEYLNNEKYLILDDIDLKSNIDDIFDYYNDIPIELSYEVFYHFFELNDNYNKNIFQIKSNKLDLYHTFKHNIDLSSKKYYYIGFLPFFK